jgi:hypothetical protein
MRIVVDQEAAAILPCENPREAPGGCGQIAKIEEIDHQQIARLCPFNAEWAA